MRIVSEFRGRILTLSLHKFCQKSIIVELLDYIVEFGSNQLLLVRKLTNGIIIETS